MTPFFCAQDGLTALICASERGHVGVVEALLVAGADTEAKTTVGGWVEDGGEGGHGGYCSLINTSLKDNVVVVVVTHPVCSSASRPSWRPALEAASG